MRKERVNINFNTQNNNQIKANFKSNNQEIQSNTNLVLKFDMDPTSDNSMSKLEYRINNPGTNEQRPPAPPTGKCYNFDTNKNNTDYALVTTFLECDTGKRYTKLSVSPDPSDSSEYKLTALRLQGKANTEYTITIPANGVETNAKQLSLSGQGFSDDKYDLMPLNEKATPTEIKYTLSNDGQDIILINLNEKPAFPMGDINGDDTVNVLDILVVVDHINGVKTLNNDTGLDRAEALDVVNPTNITVLHILKVVEIINANA